MQSKSTQKSRESTKISQSEDSQYSTTILYSHTAGAAAAAAAAVAANTTAATATAADAEDIMMVARVSNNERLIAGLLNAHNTL